MILSSSTGTCESSGGTAAQLPERGECPASPLLLPSPPNNNPKSGSYNGIVYSSNYNQSHLPSDRHTFLLRGSPARLNLKHVKTFHITHSHAPCSRHLTINPHIPNGEHSSNGLTNLPPMRSAANRSCAAVDTSSARTAFLRRRISERRAPSEMRR